jgi:hypothetical protein
MDVKNRKRSNSHHKGKDGKSVVQTVASDLDSDFPRDDDFMDERELDELKKNVSSESTQVKQPVTWQKMITRSITASFMALLYLAILYAGHFYCIVAVAILQVKC